MDSGHHMRREFGRDQDSAALCHAELLPEQSLSGGRPKTHQRFWFDQPNFGIEPWLAGGDFGGVRFGVNPPLAARLPFEVLDRVRYVRERAVNTSLLKSAVQ